ncbi:OB-fold nucleic acid binding domain-containing protein [Thermococcus sp.]
MAVLTKERIVERIKKETGMSLTEIEERIKELSTRHGISDHAAAAMLADELGISLEEAPPLMHISDLVPGMRGINIVGRILRKYPLREYQKRDGSRGQVASLLIYDNTGKARIVLWDAQASKYYSELKVGDVIKVIDATVREGRTELPELHVNFRSRIIVNPEDPRVEEIPPIESVRTYNYQRVRISDLIGGERFIELRGTIAKLYRVTVYDACPQCRKKVDYDAATDSWICVEHGVVEPIKITIVDFGIDDSTGYIRVTLFGDDAAEFIGRDPEEISEKLKEFVEEGLTIKEAGRKLADEEFYHLLGREVVVRGNVVDDKFLGLILKASSWDEVDYGRELSRIRRELKSVLKGVE